MQSLISVVAIIDSIYYIKCMASITIRNLDEDAKQALRERAAKNGHSMEEEARLLLSAKQKRTSTSKPLQSISANNTSAKTDTALPKIAEEFEGFPAAGKTIVLIITGGIAAYKCLDLIRRLRERGVSVRPIMTKSAHEFITPLSVGALAADKVFTDLFDREDEQDVGHIRLARECDAIVVAPATADIMAKMANGIANDLASTVLLASDRPILIAPAMNPVMWENPATKRNVDTLYNDGINFIGPKSGEMAESGEAGTGRMAEPLEIVDAIGDLLDDRPKPLLGKRAIITSGPTHEPIDPVRYIANRSSGKQGYAIAHALADLGAEVILVSGPVNIAPPKNVELIKVQTAREMQKIVETALPADIAIMVAAVADWRTVTSADKKMKKKKRKGPSQLELTENPDILKGVGHHKKRPSLVVGFAAETNDLIKHASAKLDKKGADWIVANDVSSTSGVKGGVMGGDDNRIKLLSKSGKKVSVEDWPLMSKKAVAKELALAVADYFDKDTITV